MWPLLSQTRQLHSFSAANKKRQSNRFMGIEGNVTLSLGVSDSEFFLLQVALLISRNYEGFLLLLGKLSAY